MHIYFNRAGVNSSPSQMQKLWKPDCKCRNWEGIIPAIETSHAFAIFKYRKFKPEDILVINLSGRGDKDLETYIDYFNL